MTKKMKPHAMFPTPKLIVSWGEVIDKLTILKIKKEKLTDQKAKTNVSQEFDLLLSVARDPIEQVPELSYLKTKLEKVNQKLWDIEDNIRHKEHAREFDDEFINLARAVYKTNDERARIKKDINLLLASEIVEEKIYEKY